MDIINYFKRITRFKPIPEQIEVLNALADVKIRNLALSCGRGFSKTLLSATAALWFADDYADTIGRPLEILLVSGQKRMYWHLNNFFRDNKEYFKIGTSDSKLLKRGVFDMIPVDGFELKNRSVLDTALGTSGSIRSHRADITFVDEACLIKDKIYRKAILPVSTGDIAKVVLLSTPSEKGFFTEIASNPKKHDFVLKQFSAEVCPWQKVSNARLKRVLTRSEYATEVLGRPPTAAERAFFPTKHILKCTVEDLLPEGGIREAGLDFGQVVGKNILTIVEKNKSRRKVLYQKHYRKPLEECLEEISATCARYKVKVIKADSKPPEYQKLVGKSLAGILVIYVDAKYHKNRMLGQLQRHIMHHTIEWDRKLLSLTLELKKYRRGKRAGDDRVDSLVLAVYEMPYSTKPKGRVFFSSDSR